MGLPGFYGRFLQVQKAKSAKKKRALVRENRRFDPLGPATKQGPDKKFPGGEVGPVPTTVQENRLTSDHEIF